MNPFDARETRTQELIREAQSTVDAVAASAEVEVGDIVGAMRKLLEALEATATELTATRERLEGVCEVNALWDGS